MAIRPKEPKRGNIAAAAAVLALAGWSAAPVLAASDHRVLCEENREATLDIDRQVLTTAPVSHEASNGATETAATTIDSVAEDHLLKSRVEATVRKVFADSIDETDAEETGDIDSGDDEVTELRLRPMSENEMVPSRRQMYRKDI